MWSDAMEMQKDEMQKARPQRQVREVEINLSGGTVLQNFLPLNKKWTATFAIHFLLSTDFRPMIFH
jgi:hypothetical protein